MQRSNPLKGVGARMQLIRERRKIDSADLAYHMGSSMAELEQFEGGAIENNGGNYLAKLMKWSQYTGTSLSFILEGESTAADLEILFVQQRTDAEDFALNVLAKLKPAPSLQNVLGVRDKIRERFITFWESDTKGVMAYRDGAKFEVDEVEVLNLLREVRLGRMAG